MTLSARQGEILCLMAEGLTAKECGLKLGISHRTVEIHVAKAVANMFARNRVHAIVLWDRRSREAS